MQWSQIKTLFILCFLVLNIYLLFQLYEQQQKHALVDDTTESTFEEQLEEDNMTVPNSVFASEAKTESFMTVEQKLFDEDEIVKTEGLVEQSISIIEKTLLASIAERSEEHTSELQSRGHLVCRLLLEKKKKKNIRKL